MILFSKNYPAALHAIRMVHHDLRACLTRLGYHATTQDSFLLAASEILTNAVKHSDAQPSIFAISLMIKGEDLMFTLKDNGEEFMDFEGEKAESHTRAAETCDGLLETGGLGLFLSGRDFDGFTYDRMAGWNIYTLSAPSPFQPTRPLILIIDDDAAQRDLIALYLAEDYDVHHAPSGRVAMEWLQDTDILPDLILCDIVMRDGNGVEFCQNLQADKAHALIPFIFMTGKPEDQTAQMAEDMPVNDFIQKPVQQNSLQKIIKRILAKARQDHHLMGDRLDADVTSILAPALPAHIGDYDLALKWQAAEAGGGDIALHLPGTDCDHIILMDIMGHGAQAKFFSHSFAGYLQGFLSAQSDVNDPADILTALSNFLYHDKIGEKTILTAQIVTIDKDGSLKIASAGHPAPLLCDDRGVHEITIDGAIPGLVEDTNYQSVTLSLAPSERLVLYTDGVMEIGDNAAAMAQHRENVLNSFKATYSMALEAAADQIWSDFIAKTHHNLNDDAMIVIIER